MLDRKLRPNEDIYVDLFLESKILYVKSSHRLVMSPLYLVYFSSLGYLILFTLLLKYEGFVDKFIICLERVSCFTLKKK